MAAPAGAGASWCRLQAELGAGTASHLPAPSGLSQAQERDSSGLRVGGRERPVFLSAGICFMFLQGLNGAIPSHARSFAMGTCHGAWTALSESLPGGVPGAE